MLSNLDMILVVPAAYGVGQAIDWAMNRMQMARSRRNQATLQATNPQVKRNSRPAAA